VPEALFGLDNVVLSPHHASGTYETRKAMGDLLIANIEAFLAGDPLLSAVA
jgi:lactate dehydrogenase-like 2-hydroxyacid dehydrogenase